MKTNYNFPYNFLDLTNSDKSYVSFSNNGNNLCISVDLNEYEANINYDVILEVSASQTFFRKLFVLKDKQYSVDIDLEFLGSKVDYSILLVANTDGEIELNGELDYYQLGDCIGVLEKSNFTIEEEDGLSGFIKIAPSIKDTIAFDLSSDWLTILLPQETYEKFCFWQNNENNIPFGLSSFGSNCIQFAIIKGLKESEFQEKKWWEAISNMLLASGYSVDEMGEEDIPGATNKILGNCIQNMFNATMPEIDHGDTTLLA